MKAAQDLFLTVDGDVVGEDDPTARFLLVRAGKDIPDGFADPVAPEPAPELEVKEAEKPANKQASKAANKSK